MPYKSDAQRRFFHTETAKKKGITEEMVKEYDQASKGKLLPKKAAEQAAMQTFSGLKEPNKWSYDKDNNNFMYKEDSKAFNMEQTNSAPDNKLHNASNSNLPKVQ